MTTVDSEVLEMAIDYLDDNPDCYGCDLHNEIYNTSYFIIGYPQAKEWLEQNYSVFDAIEKIREYEMFHFGEVNTDFSQPEKVVNMLVYILGEELLYESKTLHEKWDDCLTPEDCETIKTELKEAKEK